MAYSDDISNLSADHHWDFDGDSLDQIGTANGTDTSMAYTDTAIAKDATNCATTNAVGDRVSIPTTADIDSSTQTRWAFGGFFATTTTQEPPKSIAGRGDGTDSMRFIMFLGNTVMAEADPGGTDTICQSYGPTFLADNRVYHLFARWSGNGYDNKFDFFVDGVLMTSAEPSDREPDIASFPATTVLEFGDPAGTVSVGGTTVILNAPVNGKYQHWCTFNDADIPTDTEIRETLFERGCLADVTISSGTESAMQTSLNAYSATTRGDAPCCIEIEAVSGGGDFTLDVSNITFNALASIHIRYNGTADTLTLRNTNGSDCSITSAPFGGSIELYTEVTVKITTQDVSDFSDIQGARVLIEADTGGDLPSDDSVTSITRSATTATVTHTAHGLKTGAKVNIDGANENPYNGVKTITVTSANAYTYTVSGSPATPATGTITSTAVILSDTTDVNGEVSLDFDYSSDQPVRGVARKGTSSPYYAEAQISATITENGLDNITLMVADE